MPLPNYSTALDKSIRSICEIRGFSFIDVFLDDLDMSFYLSLSLIFQLLLSAKIAKNLGTPNENERKIEKVGNAEMRKVDI